MKKGSVHIFLNPNWLFRRQRHWIFDLEEIQFIHVPVFRRTKVIFRNGKTIRVPRVVAYALNRVMKALDFY